MRSSMQHTVRHLAALKSLDPQLRSSVPVQNVFQVFRHRSAQKGPPLPIGQRLDVLLGNSVQVPER